MLSKGWSRIFGVVRGSAVPDLWISVAKRPKAERGCLGSADLRSRSACCRADRLLLKFLTLLHCRQKKSIWSTDIRALAASLSQAACTQKLHVSHPTMSLSVGNQTCTHRDPLSQHARAPRSTPYQLHLKVEMD